MTHEKEPQTLQTGLCLLLGAIGNLKGAPDQQALAQAVILLSAGLELVLKARLLHEHWSLVFENPDEADRSRLEGGDFNSVRFKSLIARLERIAGLSIDPKAKQTLEAIRRMRNRLEHFGVIAPEAAIKIETSRTINFLLDFVNNNINGTTLEHEDEHLLYQIRAALGEIDDFVQHRWNTLLENDAAKFRPVTACLTCGERAMTYANAGCLECIFCGEIESYEDYTAYCVNCGEPLTLEDGTASCDTCDETQDSADAAREHNWKEFGVNEYVLAKEGSNDPLWECPACGTGALVRTGLGGDAHPAVDYICYGCGEKWVEGMLIECSNCGRVYEARPARNWCPGCKM